MTSAGISLTLLPLPGAAGAETFIDPDDRCLPGEDAPPATIVDRAEISEAHLPSVDCLYAEGITNGTTPATYSPKAMTTRGQMASYIVQALEAAGYTLPTPGENPFTDISGNTHESSIRQLAEIGVTSGRTPTTYAPDELVRRDQMASFMVQAAEYAFGDDEFLVGEEPVPAFEDVQPDNVHYDNVNSGALVLGLVSGKNETTFDPGMFTTREQMASFLVRLVDLTLIVE
jgi:hypothetical protein